MLPWFEPVLFPRSKTLQVRPTLHAIHYWREFATLQEKKQKKNRNIAGYSRSLKNGSRTVKNILKRAVLLATINYISFEIRVSQSEKKTRNQSVLIKSRIIKSWLTSLILGSLICFFMSLAFRDWLKILNRTNFSTCLSILLPFKAKSFQLKTTSMAEKIWSARS